MQRQPFPGPGLAIRIIDDVTPEKLSMLKEADAIVREEIDACNAMIAAENGVLNGEVEHGCPGGPFIERSVWQYFAVPPDIRSVGMMGDEEMCARVIAHINCEPYDECHKRGFLWV